MAENLTVPLITPVEPPPLPSELPIDIIHTEILPKLPPKSLLRFKAVCKSFNTIISSSEFIDTHLWHSISLGNRFHVTTSNKRVINIHDINSHSSAPSATFHWPMNISVVGSCNGLLLIETSCHYSECLHLVVLNPFTRTYFELHSEDKEVVNGQIGFNYDVGCDDYKIVVVSDMSNSKVATVYSLNSKSWEEVDRGACKYSSKGPYKWYQYVRLNNGDEEPYFIEQTLVTLPDAKLFGDLYRPDLLMSHFRV